MGGCHSREGDEEWGGMRRNELIRVTVYGRAGCILHKDSWPAGRLGAEMQPMQHFINACVLQGTC